MLRPTLGIIAAVLVAACVAATPHVARAQLPPVPTVPPVPAVPPLPTVTPPPVPTVVAVPTAVPTAVPSLPLPAGVGGGRGSGGGSAAGGSGGGGSAGGGSAGSSASGGGSAGSTSSGGGGSGGGASPASATGAASSGSRHSGGVARAASPRGGSRRQTRTQRRDQRLRRLVLALPACVQRLDTPQQRVLVLRAGVGTRAPRSRRQVAGRLDITIRRVARLERAGVRRLRLLQRLDGCSASPAGTARVVALGGPARAGSRGGPAAPATAGPESARDRGRSPVRANAPRQGTGGDFATSPLAPMGTGGGPSPVFPIVLAALAAASAAYLAVGGVRTLRARRH